MTTPPTDYKALAAEALNTYGAETDTCTSCSGSGYYDSDGSPPCGTCDGKGEIQIDPTDKLHKLARALLDLNAENQRLRTALEFYAKATVSSFPPEKKVAGRFYPFCDDGATAREALEPQR